MAKFLPAAKNSKAFYKKRLVTFSGLDRRAGAKEGSLVKSVNLSSDNYPVLSPRKKRRVKKSFAGRSVYGIGYSEKFYCCAENGDGTPYFYYDDVPYFPVSATEKTFAHVNGYICVFPDKLYFSETALKAKNADAPYDTVDDLHDAKINDPTVKSGDIYIAGTGVYAYNPQGVWHGNLTAPSDANPTPFCHQAQTEWVYIMETFGSLETDAVIGKREGGILIMSASDSSGGVDTVTDWDSAPETVGAKVGDALTLTVRFRNINSPHDSVYKKYETVLYKVKPSDRSYLYTFSGIDVPERVDSDGDSFPSGDYVRYSAIIKKSVPDFSVVFAHDNRLWGADGQNIYASALGDPTVFSLYTSSASSAWTVASLSGGSFTGGCSFSGYPTFFKEDSVIRIAGDYPEEYMTMETRGISGVAKGCKRSLAVSGGTLYYASKSGVCAYSGDFPTVISDRLGQVDVTDSEAGADSTNVYFSLGGALYCYNTRNGLWMEDSPSPYSFFTPYSGRVYALSEDENTVFILNGEGTESLESGEVISEAELSPIYLSSLDKKETGRIAVSLETDPGAEAELYISYDGGAYGKVFSASKSGVYHVPIVLRRSEYFSLKVKGKGMWRLKAIEVACSESTRI